MKDLNFDWMLMGCHHITEVAVAYFPNYAHDRSAVKAFRNSVQEQTLLMEELAEAGFTLQTIRLTPRQIAILVRHWGLPTCAGDMIKKNPYFAVPKNHRKI